MAKNRFLNTVFWDDDYIHKLNNTQKLERYHGVIKYCKEKANELQRLSVK